MLLTSCMGGGSAETGAGGPVGSLNAPGGGPVGGAVGGTNQAAGPLSIPAPASVAREPQGGAQVSCTKYEGERAECSGSDTTSEPGQTMRLTVRPYGYAAQDKGVLDFLVGTAHAAGFSTTVVADNMGAWRSEVSGRSGEVVEVCWMRGAVCLERTVLTLPTVGKTVSWGTDKMKNLHYDNQGNGFYSQKSAPAKPDSDWLSWLVPSAYARDEEEGNGGSPWYTGYDFGLNATTFLLFTSAATCDAVSGEFTMLENNHQTEHSRVYWRRAGASGQPVVIPIQGGLQYALSDILPFRDAANKEYLAVAVNRSVQILKRDGETYKLAYTLTYPLAVDKILDIGSRLLVLTKPTQMNFDTGKMIATWPHPYQIPKTAAGGVFQSQCVSALETFKNFELSVSNDVHQGGFAYVGRFGETDFRVIAGFGGSGAAVFQTPPFLVQAFDHPVQVRVVSAAPDRMTLAVLDSAQKTLKFFQYTLSGSVSLQKSFEVALSSLKVGSTFLTVHVPTQFDIDRVHQTLAFINVANEGWTAVTIPYQFRDYEILAPDQASLSETGTNMPQAFCRDTSQNLWTYGLVDDGNYTMATYRNPFESISISGTDSGSGGGSDGGTDSGSTYIHLAPALLEGNFYRFVPTTDDDGDE